MPTLSVLEKWVPSQTQRPNYAWQPSHSAKQAGPDTIPSSRISGPVGWGGTLIPKGSLWEAVKSQSSSLSPWKFSAYK